MGKMVILCQWKIARPFSECLALVQDASQKSGYINKTGKVVIPCQWRWAGGFSGGLAIVADSHGMWLKIDKTGKVVGRMNNA